jgi:MFS superfamily sulfate permease-like transporter
VLEIGPSTSVLAFVKAVIDQWAALTTGRVVIAVLALWERWHRPVPRKVYAVIVGAALVVAAYNLANQMFPGEPYIVTIAVDFLTDEQINEVNKGTLAAYVFVILPYRVKGI